MFDLFDKLLPYLTSPREWTMIFRKTGVNSCREACTEFKELCKKKQSDIPWMEELSAMEAYSSTELSFPATPGIILANEINYPAGDNNPLPNGSPDASKQETTMIAGPEGNKG